MRVEQAKNKQFSHTQTLEISNKWIDLLKEKTRITRHPRKASPMQSYFSAHQLYNFPVSYTARSKLEVVTWIPCAVRVRTTALALDLNAMYDLACRTGGLAEERQARYTSAKREKEAYNENGLALRASCRVPLRVSRSPSRSALLSRLFCRLCTISNLMPFTFLGLVISFGYSGFIPAIHLIAEYGLTLAYRQAAGGWVALMCLLYTASAVMYATRIPERFFPGKCDIWVSR